MPSRKKWNGEMLGRHDPEWRPLLELAPGHIDDFMWMFAVQLEGGPEIHAYKHWWTRAYIHLALDGRAFVYRYQGEFGSGGPSWYSEVDPGSHLDLVLPHGQRLVEYEDFLRHARQDSNLRPPPPEGGALSS